jgi:RNA polymerase-binding transcription factor DksA
MYPRNDPGRLPRGRSLIKYEALRALRRELQEEWEECVEELRFSRVGTSRDDDSVETSQAFLCRRTEQLAEEIWDLEIAMRRLAAGAYGVCADCGQPIPATRLAARPDAVRCRQCQEAFEGYASCRSPERCAPEEFSKLSNQRAAMPLPRAPRPVRAGATKELSKMAGPKKSTRRAERRKKARGGPAAKPTRQQAAAPRSKKR